MNADATPKEDFHDRLTSYLARRKQARGIDIDSIHGFDSGPDCGTELKASDIEAALNYALQLKRQNLELSRVNNEQRLQIARLDAALRRANEPSSIPSCRVNKI